MFERYTESARRALFFARYQASHHGSMSIGTAHLLLGVLQDERGLIAAVLSRVNVSPDHLRKAVGDILTLRNGPKVSTSVEIPFEEEAKRALIYAAEEADRLTHPYIGKEHLLLGLLRDERSVAGSVLHAQGIRLDDLRQHLLTLLDEHPAARQEPPSIQAVHEIVDVIEELVNQLASLPPGDDAEAVRRNIMDKLQLFKRWKG